MVKIIAIGGGEIGRPKEDGNGYYPVETSVINEEILKLTGKNHPTLLFIPTASNDSVEYYDIVKKHFKKIGFKSVDVLCLSDKTLTKNQIEDTILSHDAIYVGGGNTLHMMKTWRRLGVDKIIGQALDKGIVLSGISAGSICWFNSGISDSRRFSSGKYKLIKVTGLSYIDAIHCPHYDTEPHRQNDIKKITKNTSMIAIALDDCCAIEVLGDKYRIIKSKATAKARKIYWDHGNYIVEEIPIDPLFRDMGDLIKK